MFYKKLALMGLCLSYSIFASPMSYYTAEIISRCGAGVGGVVSAVIAHTNQADLAKSILITAGVSLLSYGALRLVCWFYTPRGLLYRASSAYDYCTRKHRSLFDQALTQGALTDEELISAIREVYYKSNFPLIEAIYDLSWLDDEINYIRDLLTMIQGIADAENDVIDQAAHLLKKLRCPKATVKQALVAIKKNSDYKDQLKMYELQRANHAREKNAESNAIQAHAQIIKAVNSFQRYRK